MKQNSIYSRVIVSTLDGLDLDPESKGKVSIVTPVLVTPVSPGGVGMRADGRHVVTSSAEDGAQE